MTILGPNSEVPSPLPDSSKPQFGGDRETLTQVPHQVARPDGFSEDLGDVVPTSTIRSVLAPVLTLPSYKTFYPEAVTAALGELFMEYNEAFAALVDANREGPNDYRHCLGGNGRPANYFVQIDMAGLTPEFLARAEQMEPGELKTELRRRVFEIENSLAVYQILERIFEGEQGEQSFFRQNFRQALDEVRGLHGKPIALLAVTSEKYEAMRQTEFGKGAGEPLFNSEVKELSGFDRFFGPDEFRSYIEGRGGDCEYMLYVRSSDPIAKLKRPDTVVSSPLLEDPAMRSVIKEHALTFNVDAPGMEAGRRINDTKGYLPSMGMAMQITKVEELLSPELLAHLAAGRDYVKFTGTKLSTALREHLERVGVDPAELESGKRLLRAKPLQGTYGCYGHVRLDLSTGNPRGELAKNLATRGAYVVQPEIEVPTVVNAANGVAYNYIDRNFLAITIGGPLFLGGVRNMMPVDSHEAKNGRIHGSRSMVCAEILPMEAAARRLPH